MRVFALTFFSLAMVSAAQSSDPRQLLQQAKQLLQQPGKAREAMPLLQQANEQWQAVSSAEPAYAESLDLYVQVLRSSHDISSTAWQAEAQPLAERAVQILDAHPDTPREMLALALEIQADTLGRSSLGASAWQRASAIRGERISSMQFNAADVLKSDAMTPLRIGNGVSPPALASKVEPQYTEVARLSKVQGSVVLGIVIGTDGIPRSIKLVRGCGYGLDEKAAETVSHWRFRPGVKDGNPVAVMAQIEVNFRLL